MIKRRIYKCGKVIDGQQAIKKAHLNFEFWEKVENMKRLYGQTTDRQQTVRKAHLKIQLSSWEKVEKVKS